MGQVISAQANGPAKDDLLFALRANTDCDTHRVTVIHLLVIMHTGYCCYFAQAEPGENRGIKGDMRPSAMMPAVATYPALCHLDAAAQTMVHVSIA